MVDRQIPRVIGVDIGGSSIRLAGLTSRGRISAFREHPIVRTRQKGAVMKQVADLIHGWIDQNGEPQAIGIGVPGFLIQPDGVIYRSPNFPGWKRVRFALQMKKMLRYPLVVENDSNCAALGETWQGIGRSRDSVLYLGLGTGVGGGIIFNGKIYRGTIGLAGEMGHMTIDPKGRKCGCGSRGCLETMASATGILDRYRQKKRSRAWPMDATQLSALARSGDRFAQEAFSYAGVALGIAIGNLINVFNPDLIIVGGRVARSWSLFAVPMKAEISRRSIGPPNHRTRVLRGTQINRAGVLGAAAVAWQLQRVEIF